VNHPIKNLVSGKAEITSQNHGFVVDRDSLDRHPDIELTHIHLNDETVAGIALKDRPFSPCNTTLRLPLGLTTAGTCLMSLWRTWNVR